MLATLSLLTDGSPVLRDLLVSGAPQLVHAISRQTRSRYHGAAPGTLRTQRQRGGSLDGDTDRTPGSGRERHAGLLRRTGPYQRGPRRPLAGPRCADALPLLSQ